jgi:serine/threonine-protein kinase
MVDVVQGDQGLFLVMEYVHGESLSRLMRSARKNEEVIPPRIVAAIMCGVLLGLHAAHETKGPDGVLLNVVHRDVSPQNVIVGSDGSARVLDFGIAKAAGRAQVTREGQIKGKLAYMAPEQIRGQVDRRTDVFAAAVVLWEMLANRRLHEGAKDVDIVTRVVQGNFPKPSQFVPSRDAELDEIVLRGLAVDPKKRFGSARELALELEKKVGLATPSDVTDWVERLAPEVLQARANLVSAMELAANDLVAIASDPPPPSDLSSPDAIPGAAGIPVHLDSMSGGAHEIPSSSAVFAHSQTNPDEPVEAVRPRQISQLAWIVVGVSCLMALVGASLGTYALVHRTTVAQAPGAAPSSATINPRTTFPTLTSTATGTGGASESTPAPSAASASAKASGPAASASASASPRTGTGGDSVEPEDKNPTAAPSTTATTQPAAAPSTGTPTSSTTATARPPTVLAPPPTVRKPAPKPPACDPPYTMDEVGHRHYKPECMGLE